MADKHPYMSGGAGLVQAITHLRKSFPATVGADTLKKLGIAPNNESYLINILRFVGVLDAEGKKSSAAATVFNKHSDEDFQPAFAKLVEEAYSELFALHGPGAWELPTDKLISFFRNADHTSSIVGQRQATTFQTLGSVCGHAKSTTPRVANGTSKPRSTTQKATKAAVKAAKPASTTTDTRSAPSVPGNIDVRTTGKGEAGTEGMALTVRIEINLPAGGDQKTYDSIFKSIRENLLNGRPV